MSSGVPSRRSGVCEMMRWRDSSSNASSSGHRIGPGRDRVDAHVRRELARERAREAHQPGLRGRVHDVALERPLGVDVGDVDDRALRLAQRRRGGLREEQRRLQVGADQVVRMPPAVMSPTRRLEERRRVVDERVEAAERLHRLLDQRRQLGDVEEVGLDQRDRLGAQVIELGLQQPRLAGRVAVVQHERRARRRAAAGRWRRRHARAPPVIRTTLPCTRRPAFGID